MHKLIVIAVLVAAFFASSAQAGRDANLCRLPNAQSGAGQAFSSRQECVRASEVFAPTLTSSPSSFGGQFTLTLTAQGLHPNATTLIEFAITGRDTYFSLETFLPRTDASGNFSAFFNSDSIWYLPECGFSTHLTIIITDSFGVHASTGVVLC